MATTYDLINVGGGIGGAALAERGAGILVLERETKFKD
jgi:choline dehydrogenase-like flavoprotein